MLLPSLFLLLELLLFLQLLRHARLPQRLPLAASVGLGIECRLQGGVPPHACNHILTQLETSSTQINYV